MASRSALPVGIVAAFVAIYLIWGTTYLAIAVSIQTLPPFLSGSLRFLLAGLMLLGWLRWHHAQPFRGLPLGQTLLCGVLMAGVGNGLVVWAQQGVPSGIAALVISATPVVVLLLDWVAFARQTPRVRALLGTGAALTGVAIIIVTSRSLAGDVRPVYVLALIGAVFGWSLGTLLQKRVIQAHYVLGFTCVQMLAGAVFQGLLALFDGEWQRFDPAGVSAASMLAVVYLVVFGSIIASNCYLWLLAHVSAHKVTTYAVVNPVVAVFLGALVLDEEVSAQILLGGALVLVGIALVLFQDYPLGWRRAKQPQSASVARGGTSTEP
jgi:drug/metabolite transporter (DMT)-like permease